jgi:pSer/pThr/pTyr-binding forkhead associated (FHA) protein
MSDELNYLDFEITVQKAGENDYIVRAESGDGEAEVRFTSPFNDDKRALIDATLTKVALRSSSKTRSSSAPEVKQMKQLGSVLFEQAISGPVREFYYKCQGQADQQGKGIRWRLALDPSIGNLPWEFMYAQDDFLALNPRSPIVRYIKGAARVAPLKAEHPLRLLVVIAKPSDEIPLETSKEKERITDALKPLAEQGLIDVNYLEGPDTWDRLCDALLKNDTHILHFIGHGAFDEQNGEGVLIMEDADRKAVRIDSERLRVLVQGKSRLRLVVLNSCLGTEGSDSQPFSSTAAGLVRSGIPAVIAMQFEISDTAACAIAQTFYTSLALNMPVDAALTEARRKIFLSNRDSLEWATPILYMQVPDGQLFQFDLEAADVRDTGPVPQAPNQEAVARLVQSRTGKEISLEGETIKVGRGAENDIVLSDLTVSRKHAKLVRSGATYKIENLPGSSGVWVNGQQVTRRALKDNDLVRLGSVEFKFQSLAGKTAETAVGTRAKRSSARTITTQVTESDESLEAKAAKRYQEGDAAMEAGDWAEAIKAFRGARLFVPNFRDAGQKLAICESRDKAATLYSQAQRLCVEKKYYQALQALDEIPALDPSLIDTDNIRAAAECGQKYQRALGELQQGNRDRAAELLRDVISNQPDFEDANERLVDLADGGDGLLGLTRTLAPAKTATYAQPQPPTPPPQTDQFRLYEIANPDSKALAEELRQYFFTQGHESQILQQGDVWVVQGKKAGWVKWLGMGLAATVKIEPEENSLKISIGGGEWVAQGAFLAAGILTGGITLITGGVGLAQQKQLMDTLWRLSENFVITRGGRRVR